MEGSHFVEIAVAKPNYSRKHLVSPKSDAPYHRWVEALPVAPRPNPVCARFGGQPRAHRPGRRSHPAHLGAGWSVWWHKQGWSQRVRRLGTECTQATSLARTHKRMLLPFPPFICARKRLFPPSHPLAWNLRLHVALPPASSVLQLHTQAAACRTCSHPNTHTRAHGRLLQVSVAHVMPTCQHRRLRSLC